MDSHLYVRGQCLVMGQDPSYHSRPMEYNSYSIQIKLHTLQLWEVGKAKDPCEEKTGCQIKFDRQNYFFNSFSLHIFLFPALNLCHVANFWQWMIWSNVACRVTVRIYSVNHFSLEGNCIVF